MTNANENMTLNTTNTISSNTSQQFINMSQEANAGFTRND
jgi:hypothetical protein